MKIKSMLYLIKEGFKNLWRNRVMSLASIGSVTATLIILGLIFLLILNIDSLGQGAKEQFDTVQVYLEDDLSIDKIEKIGDIIDDLEGIKDIRYESKKEALENMKEKWGEHGYLLEGLETNPLPNSYIISLNNIEDSDTIVSKLEAINGIEEVKFYKDIVDKLIGITNFIRLVGLIIMIILITISIFIIGNTIKLTVFARKREINIMKYIGATNWFIRWPFLIEGTILGLLGSGISLGIIYMAYKYVYEIVTTNLYVMFTAYMLPLEVVMDNLLLVFLILGSGIGALGSIMSMRKYLRV